MGLHNLFRQFIVDLFLADEYGLPCLRPTSHSRLRFNLYPPLLPVLRRIRSFLNERVRTRDDIAEMFLKRVSTIEKRAKQELSEIQLAQRSRAEKLAIALDDVLDLIDSDI